jgi:hypothetical protein
MVMPRFARLAVVGVVYAAVLTPVAANGFGFSFQAFLEWLSTKGQMTSAVKVSTAQTSLSAQQVSLGSIEAGKAFANAYSTNAIHNDTVGAIADYFPGYLPSSSRCDAITKSQLQVEAGAQAGRDSRKLADALSSAMADNQRDVKKAKSDIHRNLYCSVEEAKSGLCEIRVDGLQSADADYSVAFLGNATISPEVEISGMSYVANVADVSTGAETSLCNTPECISAMMNTSRDQAIYSMVGSVFSDQLAARRIPVMSGK